MRSRKKRAALDQLNAADGMNAAAAKSRTPAHPADSSARRLQYFSVHSKGGRYRQGAPRNRRGMSGPGALRRRPADGLRVSTGASSSLTRPHKNAWLQRGARLKEQAGYREPPLSEVPEPCSQCGGGGNILAPWPPAEFGSIAMQKQKPGAGSGRAQITSFNFPNNPSASDSSRVCEA